MANHLQTEFLPDVDARSCVLRVGGWATFREAPELRQALFDAISASEGRKLLVDLSGVERMDTAGVAVLLEALMATRHRKSKVQLCSASEAVERILRMASLVRLKSEIPDAALDEALTRCHSPGEGLGRILDRQR